VSTAATKAAADAARRAGRPAAQAGMTLVNLATGQKTDLAKIRRFAFNGELGGWISTAAGLLDDRSLTNGILGVGGTAFV